MSEEEEDDSGIEVRQDPYRHLVPVMNDKVGPGDYVEHSNFVTLQRLDCERNLWDLYVGETVVATFDANQWPTTVDLGMYVDTVLHQIEEEQQTGEEDLDARKAGDGYSSGAFH